MNQLTISEITSRQDWNAFVLAQNPNTFLHSWEWGQVQKSGGEKIIYLHLANRDQSIAAALVIEVNARRGRHYLIPHGPIIHSEHQDASFTKSIILALINHLKESARHDGAVAIRVAPLLLDNPANKNIFRGLGFKPAPLHVHAELTWVLDISSPEGDLLAQMRKTTRHAIRKAELSALKCEVLTTSDTLSRFLPLYQDTSRRHDFIPFTDSQISSQIKYFSATNSVYFVIASLKHIDVAAAILFQFGSTVFYYHGASRSLPSSLPAAQLVQWAAIREAKRRGALKYNFWGISALSEPNHPFAGITVFKKGFGGQAIDYLHAQDLPLTWQYKKLWLIDTYRKYQRGF